MGTPTSPWLDPLAAGDGCAAVLAGPPDRRGRCAAARFRWGAHHTGLPVILVAAIPLVLSWRLLKRTLRLTVEVVIALALLVVATRWGGSRGREPS